jgi:hypothetical protein
MTPKYGHFESNPARFTDDTACVCQHDNVWRTGARPKVSHILLQFWSGHPGVDFAGDFATRIAGKCPIRIGAMRNIEPGMTARGEA